VAGSDEVKFLITAYVEDDKQNYCVRGEGATLQEAIEVLEKNLANDVKDKQGRADTAQAVWEEVKA
jgi:hypothetical protein